MFVFENLNKNTGAVIQTLMIVIGGIQFLGMHFNVGLQNKMIKALHLKLQAIVDESMLKIII